jgi:DNA-binding LacI/PurR family transcriptional regulator
LRQLASSGLLSRAGLDARLPIFAVPLDPAVSPDLSPEAAPDALGAVQRVPFAAQCAAIIRAGCNAGRWTGHLPSERKLSAELEVGRITLRTALAQLKREGLIEIAHGKPTRILANRPKLPRAAPITIGFVTPHPLSRLRPFVTLWIDYLRSQLQATGAVLKIHEGRNYYQQTPTLALQELVSDNPHSAWLLYLTNHRMQEWAARSGIRAVVIGYTYPELDLPFVVPDLHAVCRHAASQMLALGHRRILFIKPRTFGPGDWHSEQGFREAFTTGVGREGSPMIVSPPEDATNLSTIVSRLLNGRAPPTAILVARTAWFLNVYSYLLSQGVQIPKQLSLVARDDESFLEYLHPAATRYSFSARIFARRITNAVLTLARGEILSRRGFPIVPSLVPGATLGPAPSGRATIRIG